MANYQDTGIKLTNTQPNNTKSAAREKLHFRWNKT